MRMTGLAFSGGTEYRCHIILPFNVRLGREIQVSTIGLGFSGESRFQVVLSF